MMIYLENCIHLHHFHQDIILKNHSNITFSMDMKYVDSIPNIKTCHDCVPGHVTPCPLGSRDT